MKLISGKIPVTVQPLFWALIFVIGWLNSSFSIPHTLVWAVVIFLSVMVHEFGHALTAVGFGQSASIELFALGGMTYRKGPPLSLWKDFIIVFNGPLAGFALLFVLLIVKALVGEETSHELFKYALNVGIFVNFFWTLVNLLPIHPLDGGHLLRILLEGILGFRGVKIAFFISILLSFAASIFCFVNGAILAGALFFMFTFENFRGWKSTLAMSDQDRNLSLQNAFRQAEVELQAGNVDTALRLFKKIRENAGNGILYLSATEYMAQIFAQTGKFREAYDLLSPFSPRLESESLRLLHRLSFQLEYWDEAIRLGSKVYQISPLYETALINALAHAIRGEGPQAIGWLRSALRDGLPNADEVLKRREFDLLRDDPAFQELSSLG